MKTRNFMALLHAQWEECENFVCIGLDSELHKIPEAALRETVKLNTLINTYR